MWKTVTLALVMGVILSLASVTAIVSWRGLEDVQITGHGYLALALGAGLSLALGIGLMSLVFFSARRGYDDIDARDD